MHGLLFRGHSIKVSISLTTFVNAYGYSLERTMDCHIHSNWGIESIAQQIEAATKGERDQKTSSSRSLVVAANGLSSR